MSRNYKAEKYKLYRSKERYTPEQREFLSRRTRPFLDAVGINRPITVLLQEAYLQGVRDAVDSMIFKEEIEKCTTRQQ